MSATEIRNSLQTLTSNDRLNATAIKNLTGKNFKVTDISTSFNASRNTTLSLTSGNTTIIPLNVKYSDNLSEFNTKWAAENYK